MSQYRFKQNYLAIGTNIVPQMSGIPNVQLKKQFAAGEVFDGTELGGGDGGKGIVQHLVMIKTSGNSQNMNGALFSGEAQFTVPYEVMEKVPLPEVVQSKITLPRIVALAGITGLIILAVKYWK